MIGASLAAGFIVLGFAAILSRLGLVKLASEVGQLSQSSLAVLRDPLLGDDAKEAAMQANARALFGKFIQLTLGLLASLLLPILLVWCVAQAGLVSFEAVMAVSLTWPFLVGGLAVFAAIVVLDRRR